MKKLFGTILLLFVVYFIFQVAFVYFQGGHKIKYYINDNDNSIEINEELRSGKKNDDDNYSLNIIVNDDTTFNVQTFYNFNRSSNIIKDAKFYSDNEYSCIFLKYRNNKMLNDVICKKDNVMYNYNSINNPSSELNNFVSSLSSYGYDKEEWNNSLNNPKELDNIKIYADNIVKNHYIGLSSSSLFYQINSQDIIKKDIIYTSDLPKDTKFVKGFTNDVFMISDCSNVNETKVNYQNVVTNDSGAFTTDKFIFSCSSYALGSYNTSLYIYDPISKKEYEIDYDNESILEVGNEETGIKCYDDGKWKYKNINENLNFGSKYENDYVNPNYEMIVKSGNKYGYYYLLKKIDNGYSVYRMDITNKNEILYLFDATSINNMVFIRDYIYYINNGSLNYYSDVTGNKTVAYSNEIFNDSETLFSISYKKND